MKFSIVTVCLNPGASLQLSAASVMAQSFQDWEYIIKDGGSSDGTSGLPWTDTRINFVSSKDNGIYDAMNQALDMCRGDYVMFLNAGDVFAHCDVLSAVAATANKEGDPELIYTFFENGETGDRILYAKQLKPFFLYHSSLCHQATYVKRMAYSKYGNFNGGFKILADNELVARLILRNKVKHALCPVIGVKIQGWGASETRAGKAWRNEEFPQIQKEFFNFWQRFLFSIIYGATLPGIRKRLFSRPKLGCLHNAYRALSNYINQQL